jgi:hypothetical protein
MTEQPGRGAAARGRPLPGTVPPPPPAAPPGATPRRNTSSRTAVVVLGIILGVVVGANLVNAALPQPDSPGSLGAGPAVPVGSQPPAGSGPAATGSPPATTVPLEPGPVAAGEGIDVGGGFVLSPPAGWTAVGSDNGIVLQKGGVLVITAGFAWDGTAVELAGAYRDQWFSGGEFTGDDPRPGSVGSGLPAAGLSYTGIWNGGHVDGAIVTAAVDGSGLIVNIVGPTGALAGVGDDLDTILASIQHVGG